MREKIALILKKTLKVILWAAGILLLLFIITALIIQIPAVQTKIVHKATAYLQQKTHSDIEIKSVGIAFPKSIAINEIFLKDLKKDTLLYAGQIKIDLAMLDLFKSKLTIKGLSIADLTAKIYNTDNDSLFNYNFLLKAFSDSTKSKAIAEEKKDSSLAFSIEDVNLSNVKLIYNDEYKGINTKTVFKQLNITVDKLDLKNQYYNIDNLYISDLNSVVLLKKANNNAESQQSSILPKIVANKLTIKNSAFIYKSIISKQSISAVINDFDISKAYLNLNNQQVTLDKIILSKSKLSMLTGQNAEAVKDSIKVTAKNENGWNVKIKEINFNDNSVAYNLANIPVTNGSFNAGHINYQHISLDANNIIYAPQKTEATISGFSATDSLNFKILNFKTHFYMDKNSISATNLLIKTNNSDINTTAKLNFYALDAIKDSLKNLIVAVELKQSKIASKDVLYFSPALIHQPFFANGNNIIVSGKIMGPVKNLKAENINVQTASNTVLQSDFHIIGLPEAKTANYTITIRKLHTGKKDLTALLGTAVIPKNINLPSTIDMHGHFAGQFTAFKSDAVISSDFGKVNLSGSIDKQENFTATIQISNFDVGSLLNDKKMFGPVTINSKIDGHGLSKQRIQAKVLADLPEFYLNQYTYHQLHIDGRVSGEEFEGKINLNDSNAIFDFDGLVNMNAQNKVYKFNLDLKGADLQKLNFAKDDLRIGLTAVADLKGKDVNTITGTAGVTKIIVAHKGKKYILDSLLFANINENGKSDLDVRSAIVGIKYTGTFSPNDLAKHLKKYINNYFQVAADSNKLEQPTTDQHFDFIIQLHDHPVISEVFLPELKEFSPGPIEGSFDSKTNKLDLNASFTKIVYGGITLTNMQFSVNSTKTDLNYKLSCTELSNASAKLENFSIYGKLADQKVYASVSSIDNEKRKKLIINSQITRTAENYSLKIDPAELFIMDKQWHLPEDNELLFGKNGFKIRHLNLQSEASEIAIASVNDKFNDDIKTTIKDFELAEISRIVEKDSNLIQGKLNGEVFLKRVDSTYGIITNSTITNLTVKKVAIGNLVFKADNNTPDRFNMNVTLMGEGNDLNVNGYFIPKEIKEAINIDVRLKSLSAKTLEAFSMGQIKEASGNLQGNFNITGNSKEPNIDGELTFSNVFINPVALNSMLQLKNETVVINKEGIFFKEFTIRDKNNKPATITGSVKMQQLKNPNFDLLVNTTNFMVLNTTAKDNRNYNGRVFIDSKIKLTGTPDNPVVNSSFRLKEGSNFLFAVPETKLSTDKGENVVVFMGEEKLNPIITRNEKDKKDNSELKSFNITSTIQIDKQATIKLLVDPSGGDSLVMKGDAALSFSLDPSGKTTLTGTYNLTDGSYLVSLEDVVKKKFDIQSGSTIIWNGSPTDADINLTAVYTVRTSPSDLLADQTEGMSDADKGGYRQRYPFLVYLKLKGPILAPEISFEIQLPQEDKGILGGAVNTKLAQLNEDPSSLNKQVFALLVLNRFIQENPLETEGNTTASTAARASAGKFLSAQLNQLSSKFVQGVDLNFDVQSYDDYSSGKAEGRTQVDVGLKKQLFNDRLSVQVGGTVDVEGEKAKQNSASDITGDVTVEYKITPNGRYRAKGFRHNQYEGALEGQLYETGIGLVYVRDFNRWKQLFTKPRNIKKIESTRDDAKNNK